MSPFKCLAVLVCECSAMSMQEWKAGVQQCRRELGQALIRAGCYFMRLIHSSARGLTLVHRHRNPPHMLMAAIGIAGDVAGKAGGGFRVTPVWKELVESFPPCTSYKVIPTCLRHQWEQPIGQVTQIFHVCSFLAFSFHFQRIWWSPRVTLSPGRLTLPKYRWHLPNGDRQLGVTWDHLQKLCKASLRGGAGFPQQGMVPTCVYSWTPSCMQRLCYFCL